VIKLKINKTLKDIDDYFSEKINNSRSYHEAVDWNSKKGQYLRFEKLYKVINQEKNITISDYGCGNGEFINFLNSINRKYKNYYGYDISKQMIIDCKKRFNLKKNIFYNTNNILKKTDFIVCSGIFNIRFKHSYKSWENYVLQQVDQFYKFSKLGFSFNLLTKYSDKDRQEKRLFYASPEKFFSICKKKYRKVTLVHDYELYEFTILVKK
jgi:SAM-dependent methyltransferase